MPNVARKEYGRFEVSGSDDREPFPPFVLILIELAAPARNGRRQPYLGHSN